MTALSALQSFATVKSSVGSADKPNLAAPVANDRFSHAVHAEKISKCGN